MKVENLIKVLQEKHEPTDDICVLWWSKPDYDNPDESTITDEVWAKVCSDFDGWDSVGADVSEWIADAIIDHTNNEEVD